MSHDYVMTLTLNPYLSLFCIIYINLLAQTWADTK